MPDSSLHFEDLIHRFVALYEKGDYTLALELLDTDGARFPENGSQIFIWKCSLLSRLGRCDEALHVLETAYTLGYWCHEGALLHDPDFEPLQQIAEFQDLTRRMAARRKEIMQNSKPDRLVIEPAAPGPHPLCLVMHGNASNINMTEPLWRPVVDRGWSLALAQSSQPGWTAGIYVWNDVEKSTGEIKTHLAEITARYAVDQQAVIAGGFSMGAHMAVRLALDPALHVRGVIAMEAWFDEESFAELEKMIQANPPSAARVCLIAGKENEEYMGIAQKVYGLLTGRGMTCQVIASSNSRHRYPPEFEQLLQQAIDWVMC